MNAGDLRDYALGQQYPCWYDPDNDRRVVVRRNLGPAWFGLLAFPFALALGALVILSWEMRGRRRDVGDGPTAGDPGSATERQ